MSYSRRNFLKAAGSGVVLTAVGGETDSSLGRGSRLFPRHDEGESRVPHQRKASRRRNTKRAPRCGKSSR